MGAEMKASAVYDSITVVRERAELPENTANIVFDTGASIRLTGWDDILNALEQQPALFVELSSDLHFSFQESVNLLGIESVPRQ